MSEADGQIRIKVNLDTQEIDKDMRKLQEKFENQNESLNRQSIVVEKLTSRYEILYKKAQETALPTVESQKIMQEIWKIEKEYKNLKNLYDTAKLSPNADSARIQEIIKELDQMSSKLIDLKKQFREAQFSPEMQDKLRILGKEIDLAIEKETKLTHEVKKTENALEGLANKRISGSQNDIDKISSSLDNMKNKLNETSKNVENMQGKLSEVFGNIGSKMAGIGKRILNLAASAFVFNIISAGFREISRGIQSLISKDQELNASLQTIKSNLLTAFYPIYQACLPALRALGKMLSWITGQIAGFVAMSTGTSVKSNQFGAKSMMSEIENKPAEKLSEGYEKIGKSAKKSQGDVAKFDKTLKKNRKELASFDKIEVLKNKSSPISNNKNPSGNPPNSSYSSPVSKIMDFSQSIPEFKMPFLDKIISKFKELADLFLKGFDVGFIDRNFDEILQGLERIGKSIKRIFNDPNVTSGFNKALKSIIYNLGVITGSIASVGVTIGRLLIGGIANFLEQSEERIKKQLIRCFDITTEVANLAGQISSAFANIFEVFGNQEAQKSLGNILSGCEAIIVDFVINVSDIMATLGKAFLSPFIDHQNEIKQAFRSVLEALEPVTHGIKTLFEEVADAMTSLTENSIKPAIQVIGRIWNDFVGIFVNAWNQHVSPKLKEIGEKFDEIMNSRVGKAIRNAVSAINKLLQSVSQVISMIWELLKPFIKWLIEGFIDRISEDIKNISITIMEVVGNIIDLIGNVWKSLEGLIDLVTGIFTGDWEKAWKGAEKVVDGFLGTIKSSINTVSSLINGVINMMIGAINTAIRALNRISFDLPDFLGGWHFGLNIPEIPKNWGNIPRLSKGAVLEGGNPFLAWINDQPRGQKNIETPLYTMIEAFKKAGVSAQNQNIIIEANGDFSEFIRILNFKLKEENARVGQSFVTGDSWI